MKKSKRIEYAEVKVVPNVSDSKNLPYQLVVKDGHLVLKDSGCRAMFSAFPDGMEVSVVPWAALCRVMDDSRLLRAWGA